jgi:LysB family phage lysis regulatory protein
MNAIAVRLVAGLVAIALAVGAWLYVRELRAELATAQGDARTAKDTVERRDAQLVALQDQAREHARQLAQLEAKRQGIAADLAARRTEIEALKDENATVRAWAAGALPADVVRLYASPAQSGADAPGPMRADHGLHAAGNGPAQ